MAAKREQTQPPHLLLFTTSSFQYECAGRQRCRDGTVSVAEVQVKSCRGSGCRVCPAYLRLRLRRAWRLRSQVRQEEAGGWVGGTHNTAAADRLREKPSGGEKQGRVHPQRQGKTLSEGRLVWRSAPSPPQATLLMRPRGGELLKADGWMDGSRWRFEGENLDQTASSTCQTRWNAEEDGRLSAASSPPPVLDGPVDALSRRRLPTITLRIVILFFFFFLSVRR